MERLQSLGIQIWNNLYSRNSHNLTINFKPASVVSMEQRLLHTTDGGIKTRSSMGELALLVSEDELSLLSAALSGNVGPDGQQIQFVRVLSRSDADVSACIYTKFKEKSFLMDYYIHIVKEQEKRNCLCVLVNLERNFGSKHIQPPPKIIKCNIEVTAYVWLCNYRKWLCYSIFSLSMFLWSWSSEMLTYCGAMLLTNTASISICMQVQLQTLYFHPVLARKCALAMFVHMSKTL